MDSDTSGLSDMSSDLSSVRSTPSRMDYPSPVSSQDQDSVTVASQPGSKKRPLDEHELPPTKKRKRAEPKPRTTEYLDLTTPQFNSAINQPNNANKPQLDLLMKVLRNRRKIVVIAGAGISVSAGIPDFRSSTGLFTTLRSEHKLKASGKHLFDASVYQTDSSTSSFHDMVRSLSRLVSVAKPTAFHQMLATLASEGRLMRLYTQNVDGIDVALPSLETSVPLSSKGPWPQSIQLHGGLEKMVCSKCSHLSDFEAALFDGPEPPPCGVCVETDKVRTDHAGKRSHGIGKLRPRIVLYNEHNPDEEAIGAVVGSDLRSRPDAVIVVGTSMKIPGVKRIVREMCGVVRGRRDGLTLWINYEPPPVGKEFEDCWDLIVKGPCDEVARYWNSDGKDSQACTESEVERAKKRIGKMEVVIERSTNSVNTAQGMLTPIASPRSKPIKLVKINLKVKPREPPIPNSTHPQAKLTSNNKVSLASKATSRLSPKSTSTLRKGAKINPKPKNQNPKIDAKFKLGKPNQKIIVNIPKAKTGIEQDRGPSTPMAQLSPSAARNNGPLPNAQKPIFPNLKPLVTSDDSRSDLERWRRRSSEIVSPTGTIPKDMAKILN